jgi:hypothetical protein
MVRRPEPEDYYQGGPITRKDPNVPAYQERKAGIYRSTFTGTHDRSFTNPETNEEEARWLWTFQEKADPTTAGVIDALTGTSLRSANSNAYKIASGIVGRKLEPGDDTDDYVGREYDVVWGPNKNGRLTITAVVPVQDAPQAAQDAPGAPITEGVAPIPDLPF